ncbi:hypothetical protein D3C81_753200 [compost metagenome]
MRNRHDVRPAGFHFLDVADGFLEHGFLGRKRDDRNAFLNQSQCAVLQLASGVRFGVNVGNLFQLQRAFLHDGIVKAAADKEQMLVAGDLLRVSFHRIGLSQHAFHLLRQRMHRGDDMGYIVRALRTAYLSHVQAKQVERDQLGRISFRRSNGNFRTRQRRNHIVRIAGDRAANHVGDR